MNLFRANSFVSHSGLTLPFKIECDALGPLDWSTLAGIVAARFEFGHVEGVPEGGRSFANALMWHRTAGGPLLIVDDVLTTGRSMEEQRAGRDAFGIVLFARGAGWPAWVTPMFILNERFGVDTPKGS